MDPQFLASHTILHSEQFCALELNSLLDDQYGYPFLEHAALRPSSVPVKAWHFAQQVCSSSRESMVTSGIYPMDVPLFGMPEFTIEGSS